MAVNVEQGNRAASGARGHQRDTAPRILDVAEGLVQRRGFNGFSYADVAAEMKITKASLHYHFASKTQLGEALVARYSERFADALAAIERCLAGAPARLDAYADLYADVFRGGRLCLCGMLAAEYQTLEEPIQRAVIAFLDANEVWVERVLEQGRRDGDLRFEGSAVETARMIMCGLEGAMLISRPYGDPERFRAAAARLLAGVTGAGGQPVS